jgi:hypothetical protein
METKVFNDNERNTLKSTNTSNVRENNILHFVATCTADRITCLIDTVAITRTLISKCA